MKIVIEIICPDEKSIDYLNAGVNRVWSIDSQVKKTTIFYPDKPSQTQSAKDSLVDDLFPNLPLTPPLIIEKPRLI